MHKSASCYCPYRLYPYDTLCTYGVKQLKFLGFSNRNSDKIRECLRLRRYSLSVLQLRPILFRLQRSCCRAASFKSLAVTRHFCSAKVLVRGLRRGMKDFCVPPKPPAKRNFQRKFALRRLKTESLLLGTEIVAKCLKPVLPKTRTRVLRYFQARSICIV